MLLEARIDLDNDILNLFNHEKLSIQNMAATPLLVDELGSERNRLLR